MRKILLPPVLLLLCALAILATDHLAAPHYWHAGSLDTFGYSLLVLGALLPIWGSQAFKRHQTNILPYKDPDNMVTDGPFKFTRNPMYLGMLFVLLGVDTLVGTIEGVAFVALFFAVANWWYIPFEEGRMADVFGDKFDVYKSSVRRWV